MRCCPPALGVLGIAVVVLGTSCGGSSSETPLPLKPDLTRARGGERSSRYLVPVKSDNPDAAAESAPADDDERSSPEEAVPSTWGEGPEQVIP